MYTDLFIINMILSLTFLFLATLTNAAPVSFLPERTILVDKQNGNFLVRGNIPIVNDQFVMNDLKAQL
jgi:hypothetical protein